ncbi:GTPase IMAP family member 6 [Oryx dammah]|uniref:GTPase IMAP family member 6 n=1 Tax=Oryx dammah TaxID=59534 RepID=UPI001A9B8B08|nr:GTPase IMAP family member 6 [Oryx dammah]
MEEEEFETLFLEEPEEGASQDPSPDGSGGLPGDEGTPQTLRLILVGKSGSGKSATGNSILGRRVFESKLSARPVTQAFQQGRRAWEGRELQVIDTPDILSCWEAPGGTAQGVGEAGASSPPGLHGVLLVTQLGRFTEEDQRVARRLEEVFGAGVLARTVLVFTRKEDLDGGSLGTYLRETDNRALAKLDVVCSRRHCGFNNKGDGAEQEAQLKELMRHIEGVLWEHEGGAYSPPAAPQPRASPHESWGLWRLGAEEGPGDQAWLRGLRRILKEPEQAGRQLPPSAPV